MFGQKKSHTVKRTRCRCDEKHGNNEIKTVDFSAKLHHFSSKVPLFSVTPRRGGKEGHSMRRVCRREACGDSKGQRRRCVGGIDCRRRCGSRVEKSLEILSRSFFSVYLCTRSSFVVVRQRTRRMHSRYGCAAVVPFVPSFQCSTRHVVCRPPHSPFRHSGRHRLVGRVRPRSVVGQVPFSGH